MWDPGVDLCNGLDGGDHGGDSKVDGFSWEVTVGSLLWAVSRDVASLTALVAGLASSVERTTIWRSAVTRNVSELATSITLHSLSLTISSKVVWSTALIASSGARSTSKTTTRSESTTKSTSTARSTTTSTWNGTCASRAWARASQMSRLTTVIATSACTGSAEAKGWAIGLDVS